jgi:protein-S-isoprenylcysteine O-methyltransferase Ste14
VSYRQASAAVLAEPANLPYPPGVATFLLVYHLASRLAYVLYVGLTLQRQERTGAVTRLYGAEAGFRRFRRAAFLLMSNDAVSFVLLCLVSGRTLGAGQPSAAAIGAGVLLLLVGTGTKLWAAATLGSDAYYWRNFFTPTGPVAAATTGPYQFLRNPMYTVGYLQTYGLALLVGSRFGLIMALFDQAAILVFYRRVEKPHFDKLDRQARTAQNQASPIRSPDP